MCGIAGFVDSSLSIRGDAETILSSMAQHLTHRGPDANGIAWYSEGGVGLSHTRLSVIDTSSAGSQPMTSSDGRYAVSYNGEIYNYRELRTSLERKGTEFRGRSDTEVLVESVSTWGLERAVNSWRGMFACAIYDHASRELTLVRDPRGKKPLYYGHVGGRFVFASELKAFRDLEGFPPELNREALALYFRYMYVPAPLSIFRGIWKVRPGSYVVVRNGKNDEIRSTSYLRRSKSEDVPGSSIWSLSELKDVFEDAVRARMVADVAVGAFLSGGIDSTLVVAGMRAVSDNPIRTFTVGFRDSAYDESKYARLAAEQIGTEHSEIIVSEVEALALVDSLGEIYDEPFADPSQIPTVLVSKFASSEVKVVLTGDGGDEFFGGYTRYQRFARRMAQARRLPSFVWDAARHASKLPILQDESIPIGIRNETVLGMAQAVRNGSSIRSAVYQDIVSHLSWPSHTVINASEPPLSTYYDGVALGNSLADFRMAMEFDIATGLPGAILTKLDRASMRFGLEARCPLLDIEVAAFARRIPDHVHFDGEGGKALLRRLLATYVPESLIRSEKRGFGIPLAKWLQGPLRDWSEAQLSSSALSRSGALNVPVVRRRWNRFLSGRKANVAHIWDVLMFQLWWETWYGSSA